MQWSFNPFEAAHARWGKLACILAFILFTQCNTSVDQVFHKEDIIDYSTLRWEQDSTVLVMSGNMKITLRSAHLPPGKYKIQFRAMGNSAAGVLPNLLVRFEDLPVKDQGIAEGLGIYNVRFQTTDSIIAPLQLEFTNDFSNETEDRNIFLHFPVRITKM